MMMIVMTMIVMMMMVMMKCDDDSDDDDSDDDDNNACKITLQNKHIYNAKGSLLGESWFVMVGPPFTAGLCVVTPCLDNHLMVD